MYLLLTCNVRGFGMSKKSMAFTFHFFFFFLGVLLLWNFRDFVYWNDETGCRNSYCCWQKDIRNDKDTLNAVPDGWQLFKRSYYWKNKKICIYEFFTWQTFHPRVVVIRFITYSKLMNNGKPTIFNHKKKKILSCLTYCLSHH